MNGKEFFLVDVIAHILHHLKCRLLTLLKDFGYNIKASDFDWVITVPAIWKSKGKGMMLEAGYMVSPKQNFANSYAYINQILELARERLLLAMFTIEFCY